VAVTPTCQETLLTPILEHKYSAPFTEYAAASANTSLEMSRMWSFAFSTYSCLKKVFKDRKRKRPRKRPRRRRRPSCWVVTQLAAMPHAVVNAGGFGGKEQIALKQLALLEGELYGWKYRGHQGEESGSSCYC
jgi:hypothetical protein